MNTVSLLLILLYKLSISNCHQYRTAVAVKQGISDYRNSIPLVESFKELVRKAKIFVDNSLFIKEVIDDETISRLIIGPRKFAKTLNMDMLRTFLEIQVNINGSKMLPLNSTENYKLFMNGEIKLDDGSVHSLQKPLLISEYTDLMTKYLGKIPVVYLNFRSVQGKNHTAIEEQLRRVIQSAFQEHKYMINVLQKNAEQNLHKQFDFNLFYSVLTNKMNDMNSVRSIQFLCQTLTDHFHQKPLVIFDNYDAPVMNTMKVENFSKHHLVEITKTMKTLYAFIFHANHNLWKGIMIGTFELEQEPWTNFTYHDIATRRQPITMYFGFNQNDVDTLFHKHLIPKHLSDQAHKWYNGYTSVHSRQPYYNPSSIANFLRHTKVDTYWRSTENQTVVNKFIDIHFGKPLLFSLLSKKTTTITERMVMGIDQIHYFRTLDGYVPGGDYLWYLFRKGYLSVYQAFSSNYIEIQMPNNEMAFEISVWMISYYKQKYHIEEKYLRNAVIEVYHFFMNHSSLPSNLEHALESLYQKCTIYHQDLSPIHSIFNCIMLRLQCAMYFVIDVYYNNITQSDIMMIHNDTSLGIIMKIRYDDDEPIRNILKTVENQEHLFNTMGYHLNTLKFVTIKVFSNKTIQVLPKLKNVLH